MPRRKLARSASILFIAIVSLIYAREQKASPEPETFLPEGDKVKVQVWVQNLHIPWSLVFLPDGRALVSERTGNIRLIKNGTLRDAPYATISVAAVGESGLMGLAIHPDFPKKPFVYVMYTYENNRKLYNKVVRLIDKNDSGIFDKIIIDTIPAARYHDGGRIAFGPDKMLYITTGDGTVPSTSQDINSLNGKILRMTSDGNIPSDNPFKTSAIASYVYSMGHRNPQGLAWQPSTGILFESEHGPSGEYGRFSNDEINIIVKGGNYGWPKIIGTGNNSQFIDPLKVWKETTPPSGMTFYKGSLLQHLKGDLFVATLRSQALVRIRITGSTITSVERWFAKDYRNGLYGRLRDIVEGPDGALYLLTNNTDGRGDPQLADDKIYRITPK